jgi:hypothetical protein
MSAAPNADEKEMKWGYAFAGVLAIGIAVVVQFAFGELDQEGQENLPAILAVPYALGGKLGLTIPLAVIGLGLVLRDILVHGGSSAKVTSSRSAKRTARQEPEEEELEMGEPLSEAVEGMEPQPAAVKIPGARGFTGTTRPAGSGGGSSSSTGGSHNGQMVLTTAKYLGTKNGKPDFRKGKSVARNDEE